MIRDDENHVFKRIGSGDEVRTDYVSVFADVAGELILAEKKKLDPKSEVAPFLKRRIPVYVDALKRGYSHIMDRLDQGPMVFDLPNGISRREIQLQDSGSLRWRIIPISNDPFEVYRFNEGIAQEGISSEGEAEIWQEPDVLKEMINKGRSIQKGYFTDWITALREVQNIEAQMGPTGQYQFMHYFYHKASFKSEDEPVQETDTLMFKDLKALSPLTGKKTKEDLEEIFIETTVVPQREKPYLIQLVQKTVASLKAIEGIFKKGEIIDGHYKQISVGYNQRVRKEDTLLAQLLIDPEFPKNIGGYQYPEISQKRLDAFYNILHKIEALSEKERVVVLYQLIEDVLTEKADKISQLFQIEGIDAEIGQLYLRSMMMSRLRHHIEQRSYTKGIDPAIFVLNGESEAKDKKEANQAIIAENKIRAYFEAGCPLLGAVNFSVNPELTAKILNQLITFNKSGEYGYRKIKGLSVLVDGFRIKFNPTNSMFEFLEAEKAFISINEATFNLSREMYIKMLLESVESGNSDVVEVVNHKIVGSVYDKYLKETGFAESAKDGKQIKVEIFKEIFAKASDHTISDTEKMEMVVGHIARNALDIYYGDYPDFSIQEIVEGQLYALLSPKAPEVIRNSFFPFLGTIGLEELTKLVVNKASEITQEVWEKNFASVWGRDRAIGITKILEASIAKNTTEN